METLTSDDHATVAALIAGLDAVARDHEKTWGLDRLPLLVGDDTRAKFFRQKARWSAAIEQAYETDPRPLAQDQLADLRSLTDGLKRGWQAMGEEAEKNGHQAISPTVWEMTLADGAKAAVVASAADAAAIEPNRYVQIWTLDEIANVIEINLAAAFVQAKTIWPQSVVKLTGPKWSPQGDEIPFGDEPQPAAPMTAGADLASEFDL